ncbi:GATA transcription factor 6-like [Trifolium pratense]|uniref:GATA transcription factor 6-like n=1 Tax=Trifolium pratense TaxID=57577 RepID=UPI001E69106B|nr:GATA transcription factor 6-like [Trifolium pratense]
MLYQTPYPLLFQFHPLPSSSSFTIPLSTISQPQLSLTKASKTEMECVETALKTSLRKDITPQTFVDELTVLNAQNGTTSDDFFVDDLLDFSHVEEQQQDEEQQNQQQQQDSVFVSLKQTHEISNLNNSNSNSFSLKNDYASLPTSDLNVPSDDVADDLEWLSHFVEDSDSFSEFSAVMPVVTLTTTEKNPKGVVVSEPKPKNESPGPVVTTFKTPVQTKARSKRTRNGVRVWPFGSNTLTESSSSSTTSSSTSSSSPTSPLLIYTNLVQKFDSAPAKKPKKMTGFNGSGHGTVVVTPAAPRRCSHCGVTKTPQWRTGPLGAKTLCNACGVRFKSGRLLPEYRPACSPTFSSELHSNHHRKVLEMRRKKEVVDGVEIETGLSPSPVVPSF